jgi:hypothetical protein
MNTKRGLGRVLHSFRRSSLGIGNDDVAKAKNFGRAFGQCVCA